MRFNNNPLAIALAGCAAVALASPAFAQETPPAEEPAPAEYPAPAPETEQPAPAPETSQPEDHGDHASPQGDDHSSEDDQDSPEA